MIGSIPIAVIVPGYVLALALLAFVLRGES